MARDNSPSDRQRKQLERKINRRASYDRILIVTEGSKTEPYYFSEIRKDQLLQKELIRILPCNNGTSPIQVVSYAKQLFEKGDSRKRILAKAFEQVYAVFDRDDHDTYFEALEQARSLNRKLKNDTRQKVIFKAIASRPCFELWLLLHFEEVQAPIHRDEVISRLKKHIMGYKKGADDTFSETSGLLNRALQRAQALATRFNAYDDPEPYTDIAELVTLLINLRKR